MPPLPATVPAQQNGKRPVGRPKHTGPVGYTNRLSRGISNEIIRSGNHPVAVMLDNMTFWHERADEIRAVVEDMLKRPRSLKERDRLVALLELYGPARHNAQRCAKDLAPYIHPRLANVEVVQDADNGPLGDLPDDVLSEIAVMGLALKERRKAMAVKAREGVDEE